MERNAPRCGFVLAEAVAALVVLTFLAAILIVATNESRRQSSLGVTLGNLKRLGEGATAYAADNDDRVFNFSWHAGVDYGFGGAASSDLEAAANQALDIIRRRTGRDDLNPMFAWVPHIYYAPLVLADYFDQALPAASLASPEDRLLLLWQRDPEEGYYALGPTERPAPLGAANDGKRWPYSSSYELATAFWSRDALSGDQYTVDQTQEHYRWNVPPGALSGRRLSEVAFPGQKIMMYERYQRHFGPSVLYFGYPEARIPTLAADGAAAVRSSSHMNRGFLPNVPGSPFFTRVSYIPAEWEPPTLNGLPGQLVPVLYRFTRSGLRGRDFGGPEVPWVD